MAFAGCGPVYSMAQQGWPFLPRESDVIVLDEASRGLEDTIVLCPQRSYLVLLCT